MDAEKLRRDLAEVYERLKVARAKMDRRANPESWCELDEAICVLERVRREVDIEPSGPLTHGA